MANVKSVWGPASSELTWGGFADRNSNSNPGGMAIDNTDPYSEMYAPAGKMVGQLAMGYAKNKGMPQFSHIDKRTGQSVYKVNDWANNMFDYPMGENRVLARNLPELHARQDVLDKQAEIKAAEEAELAAKLAAEKAAAEKNTTIEPPAGSVNMENVSDASKLLGVPVEINVLNDRILNSGQKGLDYKWKNTLPMMSWFMPQDEKQAHYDMMDYKSWISSRTASPWGFQSHFAPKGVVNYNLVEAFEKDPYGYWEKHIKPTTPARGVFDNIKFDQNGNVITKQQ